MKIRNNLILITALCLTAFALGACDYWEPADQSSINISFDDSNARTVLDDDKSKMSYTITLTSPGKDTITRTTKKGDTFISIPVSEGKWSIQVQGEGERRIGEGTANVAVTAGKPASVPIKMNVVGTKASSWDQLAEDFKELSDTNGKLKDLKSIEIVNSITATKSLDFIATQTIIMYAKNNVTIDRGNVKTPVFYIRKGTLAMKSQITIKGNYSNGNSALLNVETTGILEIYDGITITGNYSNSNSTGNDNHGKFGGGVHVADKAYFYMYGGIISGNKASDSGGGVYIRKDGIFRKTGGYIYGSNEGDLSNNTEINNKGAAVFFVGSNINSDKNIETTLDPSKNEKGEDIP